MPDKILWNKDEKKVFKQLGVADNDVALRLLIRGQRKINGRILFALTEILKNIPIEGLSAKSIKALKKAQKIVAVIPGEDPPFCVVPRRR
jgi:hypothetical protein